MATLLTLPLELLVATSSHLATPDLCALRTTCKQVEKSLYEWFSQEFFSKKQFMITQKSLQALVDISNHPGFSKKLTHVIIATNVYGDAPSVFSSEDAKFNLIEGYNDQRALCRMGIDREMMTEAFKNLPNLEVVGMRDFNARNRRRDGTDAAWSSWGAPTAFRETGVQMVLSSPMHPSQPGTDLTLHIFQNVLYALGKAGATPSGFEVLMRSAGLFDEAFHVPGFLKSTVTPVLANLKTLLLAINTDSHANWRHPTWSASASVAFAGQSLRRFLSQTPNLEHLRLNFTRYVDESNEAFLQWLAEPITPPNQTNPFYAAPVPFSKLTQLELGQLDIQPEPIVDVISKFAPTLTHVSLWRIGLKSRRGHSVALHANFWANTFRHIANIPQLKLTYFKAGMLRQDHMFVNFKTDDSDDTLLKVCEHAGDGVISFLDQLAGWSVVQIPVQQEEEEDDHHHDDDSDGDSDEEMEDESGSSSGTEDGEDE